MGTGRRMQSARHAAPKKRRSDTYRPGICQPSPPAGSAEDDGVRMQRPADNPRPPHGNRKRTVAKRIPETTARPPRKRMARSPVSSPEARPGTSATPPEYRTGQTGPPLLPTERRATAPPSRTGRKGGGVRGRHGPYASEKTFFAPSGRTKNSLPAQNFRTERNYFGKPQRLITFAVRVNPIHRNPKSFKNKQNHEKRYSS